MALITLPSCRQLPLRLGGHSTERDQSHVVKHVCSPYFLSFSLFSIVRFYNEEVSQFGDSLFVLMTAVLDVLMVSVLRKGIDITNVMLSRRK